MICGVFVYSRIENKKIVIVGIDWDIYNDSGDNGCYRVD
jgi:hypothetical protein